MKITLFAEENLKIIFRDIFFLEWKWMNEWKTHFNLILTNYATVVFFWFGSTRPIIFTWLLKI